MPVYLAYIDDEFVGIAIFDTISDLIRKSQSYFSYNDIKHMPKKKENFRIVKDNESHRKK